MNNCFFATKVSFLNEMYMIAEKSGADWDMAVEGFIRDVELAIVILLYPDQMENLDLGEAAFQKTCKPLFLMLRHLVLI